MRHREHTADRRENRYIEGEKRQTRMHRVREVHDQALPDCSHETNENVRSRLDTEEERKVEGASGQEWVSVSGMCQ